MKRRDYVGLTFRIKSLIHLKLGRCFIFRILYTYIFSPNGNCFDNIIFTCRKDIGYDGWRLDYVRGFWGGYVKDYMEVTEPYFAVGEYWDSLSYSYGEMDRSVNQII